MRQNRTSIKGLICDQFFKYIERNKLTFWYLCRLYKNNYSPQYRWKSWIVLNCDPWMKFSLPARFHAFLDNRFFSQPPGEGVVHHKGILYLNVQRIHNSIAASWANDLKKNSTSNNQWKNISYVWSGSFWLRLPLQRQIQRIIIPEF